MMGRCVHISCLSERAVSKNYGCLSGRPKRRAVVFGILDWGPLFGEATKCLREHRHA